MESLLTPEVLTTAGPIGIAFVATLFVLLRISLKRENGRSQRQEDLLTRVVEQNAETNGRIEGLTLHVARLADAMERREQEDMRPRRVARRAG